MLLRLTMDGMWSWRWRTVKRDKTACEDASLVFITVPHHALLTTCVCICVCVCECTDSTMAKARRGANKKIFFLHSCNDNISSRHLKAELNSGMMRICTSRKVCRRESSISIKQLKSVLRIHDQFKL